MNEGLYGKYIISKADGSPVDQGADYFVLRLDKDPIARRAALEYSYYQAGNGNIALAKDLQARMAKYDPKLEDCISMRFTGLQKSELVSRYEAQAKTIETLKAACHKYCGKSIWLDHPDRSLESADIAAKRALTREYPEIFATGEEKHE